MSSATSPEPTIQTSASFSSFNMLSTAPNPRKTAYSSTTSPEPDVQPSASFSSFNMLSVARTAQRTALAPAPPPSLPRSQTLPILSLNLPVAEQDGVNSKDSQMGRMVMDEDGSVTSEICMSPSWSDFGGKKRKNEKKKLEKEKKELEKRLKKDEDKRKAADFKAGKRLSKQPPPAAMDTQKMSSGLKRNSIVSFMSSRSSSQDNSRRSSRDERRMSEASTLSKDKRSRSTPASSTDLSPHASEQQRSIVSVTAPQLPKLNGFGWHSRDGSSSTDRSKSWASDADYERELLKFASRLEAQAASQNQRLSFSGTRETHLLTPALQEQRPSTRSLVRSQTETTFIRVEPESVISRKNQRPTLLAPGSSEDAQAVHGPDRCHGDYQDANQDLPQNDAGARSLRTGETTEKFGRISAIKSVEKPLLHNVSPVQIKSSTDGSSYVHKQRMYQQQRSIAGFEDEQAVKDANEQVAEDESQHLKIPNPEAITDNTIGSAKEFHKSVSHSEAVGGKEKPLPEVPLDQYHAFLKQSRNSVTLNRTQVPSGSKMDRILGFRRQQKPPPIPSIKPSISQSTSSTQKTVRLASPEGPRLEDISHATKALEQPQMERGEISRPKAPQKVDGKIAGEPFREVLETRKHSRTRTASSQLLNDDLPLPKPSSRSSTAPCLLTPDSTSPKLTLLVDDVLPESDKSSASKESRAGRSSADNNNLSLRAAIKMINVEDNIVPESKREFVPTQSNASRPSSDSKVVPKATLEVVVEGVNGEGLLRKTSIKRPRSNPQLQSTPAGPQLPSLDFLPQLKHQPLIKPKRASPNRSSFVTNTSGPSLPSSQFPVSFPLTKPPSDHTEAKPRSPLRPTSHTERSLLRPSPTSHRHSLAQIPTFNRTSTMGPPSFSNPSSTADAKPIAKLFVICCKCKFWHDLPSKLYEAMAVPKKLSREDEGEEEGKKGKGKVQEARLETMVKCPWCEHFMTTWCCAGWTTVVYLHERHH